MPYNIEVCTSKKSLNISQEINIHVNCKASFHRISPKNYVPSPSQGTHHIQ